jgi:hypothetical protein
MTLIAEQFGLAENDNWSTTLPVLNEIQELSG